MSTKSPAIRIGFTGSHGTGKTTLATELAIKLDMPFIEERARIFADMGFDMNTSASLQTQLLMLLDQIAAESNPFSYWITDRILLDYLAYSVNTDQALNQDTVRLLESNLYWLMQNRYTHVFLVPVGKIALVSDTLRPDDIAYQERIDTTIRFYLEKMKIPYHTIESSSLEDRMDEVLEVVY